ncbi:hypothetical protein [Nocardioides salsibiostraticola]
MNQRIGGRPSLQVPRVPGLLAGAVALGLLLSACGSSEPDTASEATPTASVTASESPSEPTEPTEPTGEPVVTEPLCSEVWVADEQMPDPYKGCYDGDAFVKAESERCAFGAKLFTYGERFYAAQFNKINETEGLAESAAYQKAVTQCGG